MATQADIGALDVQEQIARISKIQEEIDKEALDLKEQIARIARIQEEIDKNRAEARKAYAEVEFMPRSMIFQAMLASAALIGAGAAVAKLLIP